MGSLGHVCGSSGSFGFSWVHFSWLGAVGIIRVSLGSIYNRRSYWPQGSFEYAWVQSGAPNGRRVYSGSGEITRSRLSVVGFSGGRQGSLGRS